MAGGFIVRGSLPETFSARQPNLARSRAVALNFNRLEGPDRDVFQQDPAVQEQQYFAF
ncbi:hypothetical protein [Rhodalgimonas zhirmunskyi]|uniref:hypothetical protein n=1 Tax=Rhodalgimonas zhirmunskyi TaxID=2964767 RepID=UPI002952946D|nr:hypothetical protein [Rhodoalgimonas zhirmunskyi]